MLFELAGDQVAPERAASTWGWKGAQLDAIVTRDGMIGVASL